MPFPVEQLLTIEVWWLYTVNWKSEDTLKKYEQKHCAIIGTPPFVRIKTSPRRFDVMGGHIEKGCENNEQFQG